jgi:hypothetical protein
MRVTQPETHSWYEGDVMGFSLSYQQISAGKQKPVPAVLLTCLLACCMAAPIFAQEHKSKVPIVGKLTSGNQEEAYSGKVQSLDLKQQILSVNSLRGRDSEIFPVKKNVRVEGINGNKMKLSALTPGTTVLIYYDQKAGERTVKNIVVLSPGETQEKTKSAPSS